MSLNDTAWHSQDDSPGIHWVAGFVLFGRTMVLLRAVIQGMTVLGILWMGGVGWFLFGLVFVWVGFCLGWFLFGLVWWKLVLL